MNSHKNARTTVYTRALLMRRVLEEGQSPGLRDPEGVEHPRSKQRRRRVHQIAAGDEDCDDAEALRGDPAFKLAAGAGSAGDVPGDASRAAGCQNRRPMRQRPEMGPVGRQRERDEPR